MARDNLDTFGDPPAEEDLPEAWKRTIEECQRRAKWKTDINSATASIDDIIKKINSPSGDVTQTSDASKVFNRTLRFVRMFGGVVADGASVVFAPSQQIFNAVNCLVGVIQAYQDVFDTLTTLMDRASVFFERLSMYWEQQQDVKLDKNLRPKIYRVLADFVEIMTQTYRLTDGWKGRGRKFKLALFGETDEVTKLLDKFEMHVADVTDQTVSQIHLQLSKAALDLCDVQQELHDFRLEQAAANKGIQSSMQQHGATLVQVKSHLDDKKDNDQLREKLGIKDEHDFSWKIHNERFTDSVHGSSSWLSDVLKDWEDVRTTNQAEHSILGLVGPENFGKSYLCHQIINRLGRLNIKSSIAWFYVQKEKRTSVHEAIKHIIWQFARTEQTFLDYIKPLTKDFKPGEAGDLAKIWQDLVMGYSKKKPHTVFFVVIDGIDQFDKTSSADVLSEILLSVRKSANEFEGLRVRLLLSGREESFQDLESSHTSSFQKIDLRPTGGGAYLQESVIKQMITRELDKIFKGELSDEDSKLRSRIEETLLNVDKGNFDTIKRLLGDIAQCNLPSQMEKVLQEAMRGSEERLKEDINTLNKQLLGPEIDQLNLLLRWLAAAKESTNSDSDILRSILSLSFRVDVLRDPVDFLRRNCSTLLNMDNEMITLPQEVLDALEAVKSERDTLEESEIRLIESIVRVHFERTFGNREVYDKFEFPAFFGSKANVQSTLVHVPKQQERELSALDLCLKAICDLHDSDQHKDLRNYAAEYFDEHLVQAKLLDVESLVRQQVGRRLWRVLRDEYVLDVWVDRDRMWGMMYWFSVHSQVCPTIVSWMQDKEVQIGLQSVTTERDWLQDVVADGTSEFKALEYVGRHILRRWSESSDDMEWERLLWLRIYHQKMTKFDVPVQPWGYIRESPSARELRSLETWAKGQISIEENARWHSRIANLHLMANTWYEDPGNELLKAVIKRCNEAIRLDSNAWKAHLMKGEALFRVKNFRTCLEALIPVVEQESIPSKPEDDDDRWSLANKIGECYAKLEELDNAELWYQKVLDHTIERRTRNGDFADEVSKLLGALLAQAKYAAAFALLQRLDGIFDDSDDDDSVKNVANAGDAVGRQSWLMNIISEPCEFHKHIIVLAQQSEKFSLVDEFYQRAGSSLPDDDTNLNLIRFNQWRLHWYLGSLDQQDLALSGWESLLGASMGNKYGHWPTWVLSVKQIAHGISRKAAQDRSRSLPNEAHIARLERIQAEVEKSADEFSPVIQRVIARLHHLSGETWKARNLLRAQVKRAFTSMDDEDEEDGFAAGAKDLANILPLIDDDVNAVAAWRLMEPKRTAGSNADDAELTVPKGAQIISSDSDAAVDANTEMGKPDEQAVAGAQNPIAEPTSLAATDDNDAKSVIEHSEGMAGVETSADSADSLEASQSTSTDVLKGDIGFYCDGGCGHDWTFADNMYICKDCVDVQFDEKCHKKLKDGKLDITVCSPGHSHLHVPPFDVDAWKRRRPEEMVVGDQIILRSEWLKKLKNDWGDVVLPGTTRALVVIQRRWLRILKARRERMALEGRGERMATNRGL